VGDTSAGHPDHPGRYRIRLEGRLESRWASRFDGMTLTAGSDGITVLEGPVVDQAALHGLLRTVNDLGLPLLSVTRVETDRSTCPPPNPGNAHAGDLT
jgi:hypothetical protein